MEERTQTFLANRDGVVLATQFLQSCLDEIGCAEKTKASLMVALDEIVSNIVYYSGAKDFEVAVSLSDDSVRVVFSDRGKAFDPLKSSDPDISLPADKRNIGGLGLFMVKRMMDELHYIHDGEKNILTIIKKKA